MKILAIADEECDALWDYYVPGRLASYQLMLSAGDLHASYLSFLVTMGRAPLLYVHGNHDIGYGIHPPQGCDNIDGDLVILNGLRILGLGGCYRYRDGDHQYTEKQMRKRIRRLRWKLKLAGGVDIVVTHAQPRGLGDDEDLPHRGFEALVELIDEYHPKYLLHGHIHLRYGMDIPRLQEYHGTKIINVCERYDLDIPDPVYDPKIARAEKIFAFWKRLHEKDWE